MFGGCLNLLLLLVLISAVQGQEQKAKSSRFLWISDVHFDPFYSQPQAVTHAHSLCAAESSNDTFPYGQVGCDSPLKLITETLRHAKQTIEENGGIDFIVVTGDICRHGNDLLENPVESTRQILRRVFKVIQSYLPDSHILATVGNNDFTPDYYIDLEQTENNTMLNMVTEAFHDIFISTDEETSFLSGAYFARNISEALTLISINTVIYSSEHSPKQTYIEDPLGQFAWLAEQLQIAMDAGRRVIIAGHIPPSVGSYRRAQQWHESYTNRYYEVIKDFFPDVIAAQLFGHLHTDEFRLVNPTSSGDALSYPLFMSSSITPIYGSNPSYRLVEYDTTSGMFLDYDTFYFRLNSSEVSWIQAPSFREAYNVSDMSNESMELIVQKLSDDSSNESKSLWVAFLSRQNVYSKQGGNCDDSYCHREWICTITSITEKDYESCVYTPFDTPATLPLLIFGLLTFLACLLTIIWRIRICIKRRGYLSHLQETSDPVDGDLQVEPTGSETIHNEALPPIS
eukprot:scaffold9290_cov107-Cylindrotheca_fusiformis.AAC.6